MADYITNEEFARLVYRFGLNPSSESLSKGHYARAKKAIEQLKFNLHRRLEEEGNTEFLKSIRYVKETTCQVIEEVAINELELNLERTPTSARNLDSNFFPEEGPQSVLDTYRATLGINPMQPRY
jgi:hypothetical protein